MRLAPRLGGGRHRSSCSKPPSSLAAPLISPIEPAEPRRSSCVQQVTNVSSNSLPVHLLLLTAETCAASPISPFAPRPFTAVRPPTRFWSVSLPCGVLPGTASSIKESESSRLFYSCCGLPSWSSLPTPQYVSSAKTPKRRQRAEENDGLLCSRMGFETPTEPLNGRIRLGTRHGPR